jgi:hypothetical protein
MRVFAFIILIFLTACKNYQHTKGFVLDKSTNDPIDSVRISTFIDPDSPGLHQLITFSGADGSFQLNGNFGLTSDSLSFILFFSKPEYRLSAVNFTGSFFPDTIYLERE